MTATNGFSQNALRILKARYFMKNEKGEFLDKAPSDLFWRVARFVASAERTKKEEEHWAHKFLEVMIARDFFPKSPTLTEAVIQMWLSACCVIPIDDSMQSISEMKK